MKEVVYKLAKDTGMPSHLLIELWNEARASTNREYIGKPVSKTVLEEHALASFSYALEDSYSFTFPQWFLDLADEAKKKYVKLRAHGNIAAAYLGKKIAATPAALKQAAVTSKRAAHIHYRKSKSAMRRKLVQHKEGLVAIKDLMLGKMVSDKDKEKAKETAKFAGKVLLGGLAVAGLFLGLGPFLHVIGNEFLNNLQSGSAETSASDSHEQIADDVLDRMYAWISKDPEQLAEFLKAKYGTDKDFKE